MTEEIPEWRKKVAESLAAKKAKAELLASAAAKAEDNEHFADVIPADERVLSDEDRELDRVVEAIGILAAYNRWCGKMTPKVRTGQTESVMVSCPKPSHRDSHPSAWLNLDKGTWYCGTCSEGGDAHDIAAYYHSGYKVPDYKTDGSFHDLRVQMAEDFGYTFVTYPGNVTVMTAPVEPTPESAPEVVTGTVVSTPEHEEPEEQEPEFIEPEYGTLDWRPLVPEGTFLDAYMKATSYDDTPEEYHFFTGLLALGFACGRQAVLKDIKNVYGNLFVCTIGHTGTGKSRSLIHLMTLLKSAMPFDPSMPAKPGVDKMTSMASAEALINAFQLIEPDPTNPKGPGISYPVRGLIVYNELAALATRTSRLGSAMQETLYEFYDADETISSTSMTTGRKEAKEPFGSLVTTTQPRALNGLLTRKDGSSGFLNRLVFVPGTRKQRIYFDDVTINLDLAIVHLQDIVSWVSTTFKPPSAYTAGVMVRMGADAKPDAVELLKKIDKIKEGDDSGILDRMDLLAKKLMLLLTINLKRDTVERDVVAVIDRMLPYLLNAYGATIKEIDKTEKRDIADEFVKRAKIYTLGEDKKKTKNGISIAEFNRLTRKKFDQELLLRTVDTLVKVGQLEVTKPNDGLVGRPVVRYKFLI